MGPNGRPVSASRPRQLVTWLATLVLASALAACSAGTPESTSLPVPRLSPTPPVPSPSPWTVPASGWRCEGGWRAPNQRETAEVVRLIGGVTGLREDFRVEDIRRFAGPESPPREDVGYLANVDRWYVKGGTGQEASERGRFLVEERQFGIGLVAVAPYDTRGFSSPDWVGIQLDESPPRTVSDIPGRWQGDPYDFVAGGSGLALPGLPAAVAGCLDGT